MELANHDPCGLGGVVALGVLDGAEFLFADHAEGHHGPKQREGVEQELLELPALLDTANRLAGGVPRELSGLQFAKPIGFEQVDGDVAAVEGKAAVGVGHVAVVLGKVAVFHHAGLAVLKCEYTNLFVRAGLGDYLGGRHAATFAGKRSDECRVANAAQRVVHAVEEHVTHALLYKPSESSALRQRTEASAVSVGNKCQTVVFVYDGLAVRVQGADGALLKETHVVAVVTEKAVFGKEVDGSLMVQGAGHNAPGNGVAHLRRQVQQPFRLQLEQALVARESDVEHSLRAVETQA